MTSSNIFTKDPSANLTYSIDWSEWLAGDTIASVVWTTPAGLTNGGVSNTATIATIRLSGGTAGQDYTVGCQITTVGGNTDERSLIFKVRER